MKYTIEGFNQEEVIKLGNLDVIDLVILRWIVDFESKMTKKEIDGEIYFWVNYQSLLEALPILNIKKRMLCYRLEKMCNVEILKHKNVKDKGNYSYYTFGKNYINLVQNIANDKKNIAEGFANNCLTLKQNIAEQNNSSIKEIHLLNNSKEKENNKLFSKESSKKFVKPSIEEIKDYCQERNNNVDAEQFYDYYESNGWKVGRNSMKDWKACIRTWEKNNRKVDKHFEQSKMESSYDSWGGIAQ